MTLSGLSPQPLRLCELPRKTCGTRGAQDGPLLEEQELLPRPCPFKPTTSISLRERKTKLLSKAPSDAVKGSRVGKWKGGDGG